MKKLKIAFCFLTFLAAPLVVHAKERTGFDIPANETSLSAGFEFGNALEHHPDDGNNYFGSPGMNIEGYSFWNGGNFGMFYHGAFMFPVVGEENHDFQWGAMIGPAFRVRFTEKLTLQTGIGFGVSGTDYYSSAIFLAVGADA